MDKVNRGLILDPEAESQICRMAVYNEDKIKKLEEELKKC